MTTKQKILETTLGLFNQDGATEVSTNHIATALGMSPGNLYYHYRNKEEIIRALFSEFDNAANILYSLPSDKLPTIDDLERMIEGTFELQWRYRFFFRDLMSLLRRDADLETAYRVHRQRGFKGTRQLINLFASTGVIAAINNEQDLDELTRLIWMVSEFWLPSLELGGETVTPERFKQGVLLFRRISQLRVPASRRR
jgi:AcrR family transcriptional regulator